MGKAKPAPLGASLIVKGGARPVEPNFITPESVSPAQKVVAQPLVEQVESASIAPVVTKAPVPEKDAPVATRTKRDEMLMAAIGPTKSMTVKIDEITYKKLKMHGVDSGRSSQDIFVDALGLYFKTNKL